MKPCFNCKTFDGTNNKGIIIALQSTKYGNLCPKCIDEGAGLLWLKKVGKI